MLEDKNDILRDFLSEPKEAAYRLVSLYQSEITQTEAMADLEELQYLMDNRYCAYFADLLVEKIRDGYIVIESQTKAAVPGDRIDSIEVLYPTLAPAGKEWYLAGIRSYEPVHCMGITVNGREAEVPLHHCLADMEIETEDVCFKHSRKMGVDILRSNCCDYVGQIREDTDFISMGRKYAETERLILNYLSNEGGYNRMTREFIKGLNGYVHCPEYSRKLISPVMEGHDCMREWVKLSDPAPYAREKGVYDGTCIMLVNNATASVG